MSPTFSKSLTMNMDDIKKEAALAANTIDINWEQLDNPTYRKDFENVLKRAQLLIPDLESLYLKLSSGKSVLLPDEPTSLSFEDTEKYREIVEEELFNGYILQELYHKYESINAVMKAALDNPPPDQLDLFS
jgi:hypothetical protein